MSWKSRTGEPLGRALQRACCRHVDRALLNLKAVDEPEAVHNVRRQIKRMRSVFRLTRGSLPRKEYRKTAKIMRLAAKTLAATRDASVTKRAFESLAEKKVRQFPEIKHALESHARHAESNFANNDFTSLAKFLLKSARRQLDDLDLGQAGWPEVRTRLEKSCALGCEAHQESMRKPAPRYLHEWRKQVKNLWHQLDFISPHCSAKFTELLDGLEKLGEALGNDHDLVLLEHFAKEHGRNSKETIELQRLIDNKRREYGVEIKRLGARVFAQLPEKLCAKLDNDLKLPNSVK